MGDTAGIEHGDLLAAFAEAVARGDDSLAQRRAELRNAAGDEMLVEAAAVAAVFHGYVRVADGTGIPVDELVVATSFDLRDGLGVESYAGSENTDVDVEERPASDFNPALQD